MEKILPCDVKLIEIKGENIVIHRFFDKPLLIKHAVINLIGDKIIESLCNDMEEKWKWKM